MANAINWFEIPAANFERARKFYNTILARELHVEEMQGIKMAMMMDENPSSVGGAICHGDMYKPSADGAVIYLNGGNDLDEPLARVEAAGGKVVLPKTQISPEIGYMAYFMDTEGNRMAFHSPN